MNRVLFEPQIMGEPNHDSPEAQSPECIPVRHLGESSNHVIRFVLQGSDPGPVPAVQGYAALSPNYPWNLIRLL